MGTGILYHAPMELNRWIIEARARAQMTQQQLADALGVTKSNVSAWENSRHEPGWSQMLKIRQVTGLPLPVDDMQSTPGAKDWPFEFPASRLDQLDERQLAAVERILVSAIELAAMGMSKAPPFSTSGNTGEAEQVSGTKKSA